VAEEKPHLTPAPAMALLFKAKYLREKGTADLHRVLQVMGQTRRARLIGWLTEVHPATHKSSWTLASTGSSNANNFVNPSRCPTTRALASRTE
jgi:hypothetical protein